MTIIVVVITPGRNLPPPPRISHINIINAFMISLSSFKFQSVEKKFIDDIQKSLIVIGLLARRLVYRTHPV